MLNIGKSGLYVYKLQEILVTNPFILRPFAGGEGEGAGAAPDEPV
jgi:hypothetical protein